MPQPNPMKLALMSSQLGWGGGEQFLWSLGTGLVNRGHSVLWICDAASPLYDRIRSQGLDSHTISGRLPSPQSLLGLRSHCNKLGVQLLHANDSHALTWGSLATLGKLGIKRVGVKHTAFPIRSAVRYNWMLDKLVCVSNAVRDVCTQAGIALKRTHVIHGGVEPSNLERTYQRFLACEQLGISSSTPLYCAVGSLTPCKAYERIIEAANQLRWHLPEFCIVICGEGKSRESLEQLIRKYDLSRHVRLLGFQHQPERWIAAADAFVHSSSNEGLSLVAIQSQMVGTPVITTEVGGLKEVMRSPESGELLGWTFQGNDPSLLPNLMIKALENTPARHAMVHAARQSALQRFHVDRMVDQFEELYTQMLANSRTRGRAMKKNIASIAMPPTSKETQPRWQNYG